MESSGRNADHVVWLQAVIDRAACALIVKTQCPIYQRDLASHLEKHFANVDALDNNTDCSCLLFASHVSLGLGLGQYLGLRALFLTWQQPTTSSNTQADCAKVIAAHDEAANTKEDQSEEEAQES